MKKSIIVIISLFYSFISVNNGLAAIAWTQKANFGGINRTYAVGFSMGNKGYIGTGFDMVISGGCVSDGSGITCSPITMDSYYWNDFWEYDSTLDTWTQKADFGGTARSGAVGFSIGNKGYIGTGYSEYSSPYYKKDFWEYDPTLNTWTQRADFGGTARGYAVGFSIGSKGYIGTGKDGSLYYNDFWEYIPTANTWTQKADFGGITRAFAVGFSIGSNGYIGTGEWYDSNVSQYKGTNDFWEYSPTANIWTHKADFGGTVRSGAVGFSIGNRGYIGTGLDSSPYCKDFWEYEPVTNTWIQRADFGGTARSGAVGFFIGSKGYIGTGSWDTKDFWEYEPADTTPDPFTFADRTNVALNTAITSNTIAVSGIDATTPISISSGTYAINGGSYTSISGTVSNGDTVTVQQTSSGSYSTTTNATLTIGGVSDTFSVTTQTAPASDSGGKKCFIATAAFGSPMERHVQILRDFRDRYLLNFQLGQKFVKLYYRISPPIADTISKNEALRMITRWCLMPFIGIAYLTVLFGIVPTLLVLTISILMLFSFVWLSRKRFKHDLRGYSAK